MVTEHIENGEIVELGSLGRFRMTAGSKGVEKAEDFNTSLFRKGRIVFTPGKLLERLRSEVKFEKLSTVTVTEECDQAHV